MQHRYAHRRHDPPSSLNKPSGENKSLLQAVILGLGKGYTANDIVYRSRNKRANCPRLSHKPKWVCCLTIANRFEFTSGGCHSKREAELATACLALSKWDVMSKELQQKSPAIPCKTRYHISAQAFRQLLQQKHQPEAIEVTDSESDSESERDSTDLSEPKGFHTQEDPESRPEEDQSIWEIPEPYTLEDELSSPIPNMVRGDIEELEADSWDFGSPPPIPDALVTQNPDLYEAHQEFQRACAAVSTAMDHMNTAYTSACQDLRRRNNDLAFRQKSLTKNS